MNAFLCLSYKHIHLFIILCEFIIASSAEEELNTHETQSYETSPMFVQNEATAIAI